MCQLSFSFHLSFIFLTRWTTATWWLRRWWPSLSTTPTNLFVLLVRMPEKTERKRKTKTMIKAKTNAFSRAPSKEIPR